jgi:stress response protein YsnF
MGVAMHGQCLVAVYPLRSDAERAYEAVIRSGIPGDDVWISGAEQELPAEDQTGGRWGWLFGSAVGHSDRQRFGEHLAAGRTALSVFVEERGQPLNVGAVEDILERYGALDVHFEEEGGGAMREEGAGIAREGEQVIPLAKEELKVGKRATERVTHIRTYVIEEPVERDVTLQDERAVIEKRPARSRAVGSPQEREYEIRERHEEPVVQKETRADEELVVHKKATGRTERVRDTVRRTKADVEKAGVDK